MDKLEALKFLFETENYFLYYTFDDNITRRVYEFSKHEVDVNKYSLLPKNIELYVEIDLFDKNKLSIK